MWQTTFKIHSNSPKRYFFDNPYWQVIMRDIKHLTKSSFDEVIEEIQLSNNNPFNRT